MGDQGRVLHHSLHEHSAAAACIRQKGSAHKRAGHHSHECYMPPTPSHPSARALKHSDHSSAGAAALLRPEKLPSLRGSFSEACREGALETL